MNTLVTSCARHTVFVLALSVFTVSHCLGISVWPTPSTVSNVVVFSSAPDEISGLDTSSKTLLWTTVVAANVFRLWGSQSAYIGLSCTDGRFRVLDALTGKTTLEVRVSGRVVGMFGDGTPLVIAESAKEEGALLRLATDGTAMWRLQLPNWSTMYYGVVVLDDLVVLTEKSRTDDVNGDDAQMRLWFVDGAKGDVLCIDRTRWEDATLGCDGSRYCRDGDVVLCPIGKCVVGCSRKEKRILYHLQGFDAGFVGRDEMAVAEGGTVSLHDVRTGGLRRTFILEQSMNAFRVWDGQLFNLDSVLDLSSGKVRRRSVVKKLLGHSWTGSTFVGPKEIICTRDSELEVWLVSIDLFDDSVVWLKKSGLAIRDVRGPALPK